MACYDIKRTRLLRDWVKKQYKHRLIKKTSLPYFNHLVAVADMAAPFVELGCEIGLCHDIIEDGVASEQDLYLVLKAFGYTAPESVAIVSTVIELTDFFTKDKFPLLDRPSRKILEAERILRISSDAQSIKYADLMYNTQWMLQHELPKAKDYLEKKKKLLLQLNKGHETLYKNVTEAIENALRAIPDAAPQR